MEKQALEINMNATPIGIRRIDDLGRISIPKTIRKIIGAEPDAYFEIRFQGGAIVITPSGMQRNRFTNGWPPTCVMRKRSGSYSCSLCGKSTTQANAVPGQHCPNCGRLITEAKDALTADEKQGMLVYESNI
jgi:bifunctional DNA-binding transcriptional regulator/antitoxin component of YhaV-PrlF toxin-antitoxin module